MEKVHMSLSCEKVKTSNRTTEEEVFLEKFRENPQWQMGALREFDPKAVLDPVNHPAHYNNSPAKCDYCGRRIECIDVTRHYAFNIGNAIKYLWRCDLKGNSIEDLKKAAWYINDEIRNREKSS
jgi:hypothetical protein